MLQHCDKQYVTLAITSHQQCAWIVAFLTKFKKYRKRADVFWKTEACVPDRTDEVCKSVNVTRTELFDRTQSAVEAPPPLHSRTSHPTHPVHVMSHTPRHLIRTGNEMSPCQ